MKFGDLFKAANPFGNKGGLIAGLFVLLQGSALQMALGLLASVLRVRVLGAEWFGKTAFLITILAVLPTTYDLFNDTLLRFYRESEGSTKKRLFIFSLLSKLLFYIVIGVGVLAFVLLWNAGGTAPALNDPALRIFFLFYLAGILFDLFRTTLLIILKSEGHYGRFVAVTAIESLLGTCFAALLLWAGVHGRDAVAWLGGYVLVNSVAQLGIVSWLVVSQTTFRHWIGKSMGPFWRSMRFVFGRYFRPYSLPQSPAILFAYIKKNVGTIVLGSSAGFEQVTYYKILMRIVDVILSLVPRSAQAMLPAVIEARKRSEEEFEKKYLRLGRYYLLGSGAISLALYFAAPVLFRLYGLRLGPEVVPVVLILCLLLHQHALAFLVNFLYNMSATRWPTYFMIPTTNAVYIVSLILLAPFGLLGVALAHLLQRTAGTVMHAYFGVLRLKVLSLASFTRFALMTAGISLLLVLLHFARSLSGRLW